MRLSRDALRLDNEGISKARPAGAAPPADAAAAPPPGVTVPTLHMSMAFTTGCWYSDPHSLPWIEYLHTGAAKVRGYRSTPWTMQPRRRFWCAG